jgi:hypothetical protein
MASARELDTASMASGSSFSPMMHRYLDNQQTQSQTTELVAVDSSADENITLDEFKQLVRKWLELDNFLKKAQEAVREKRKTRDQLSSQIVKFMIKYNIEDLNTKEGRIRCKVNSVKAPVNQKVIKQKLDDYFGNREEEKNKFLSKIYEERETTEKVSLRRLKIS